MSPTPTPTITVVTGGSSLVPILALVASVVAVGISAVGAWFEVFKWRMEQPTLDVEAWPYQLPEDNPTHTVIQVRITNPGKESLKLSGIYLQAPVLMAYEETDTLPRSIEVPPRDRVDYSWTISNIGAMEGVPVIPAHVMVIRRDKVAHSSNEFSLKPTRFIEWGND
jgi:hypothetical protein